MNEKWRDLLVRSYDDKLSATENQELEQALRDSAELRAERQKLEMVRNRMRSASFDFGPGFSDSVMERIGQPDISPNVFGFYKKVTYAGVAAIAVLLFLHHWSGGSFSIESFIGVEPVTRDVVTFNVIAH